MRVLWALESAPTNCRFNSVVQRRCTLAPERHALDATGIFVFGITKVAVAIGKAGSAIVTTAVVRVHWAREQTTVVALCNLGMVDLNRWISLGNLLLQKGVKEIQQYAPELLEKYNQKCQY